MGVVGVGTWSTGRQVAQCASPPFLLFPMESSGNHGHLMSGGIRRISSADDKEGWGWSMHSSVFLSDTQTKVWTKARFEEQSRIQTKHNSFFISIHLIAFVKAISTYSCSIHPITQLFVIVHFHASFLMLHSLPREVSQWSGTVAWRVCFVFVAQRKEKWCQATFTLHLRTNILSTVCFH